MYISCPNCTIKFIVLPEQVGISGRKVKCSKCNHIWYHKLDNSSKLIDFGKIGTDSITTLMRRNVFYEDKAVNVPALASLKTSRSLYILPIVCLSLIILLSLILFHGSFTILPLFQHRNLTIEDIHVVNIKDTSKMQIFYKITNSSNQKISIPLIRIQLLDQKQSIVESHIIDKMNITLAPKQHINMKTTLGTTPSSVQQLNITVGNRLDFILGP